MASRSTSDTCCLTLPLILEKWQADRLEKRLEIARHIYNTLVHFELKKLWRLEGSAEYAKLLSDLRELTDSSKDRQKRINIYRELERLRQQAGFSEYGFKTDIKEFYKHFHENIGSHVAVHGIAPQVWNSFDRFFHGNGKAVHYKKRGELTSVRGYSVTGRSGGSEIIYHGETVDWKDLHLRIKHDPTNPYEQEMLLYRVKYCRIIKRPGKNNSHWYVQLSLEGKPVIKTNPRTGEIRFPLGTGRVGIDIGPQTIAYSSQREIALLELADKVQSIEREKRILQRKLDRSRRAMNPENYLEDGTIRRGVKLTRNKSKKYLQTQRALSNLMSKQADIRKIQHNDLANHLLTLGDRFIVEQMEWPALTHRALKTEISEKTGRYKRKKRFGKSVGNKAPAMLITLLDLKLKARGSPGIIEVPTSIRASQFNHLTGEYRKKPLSERWNYMPDGNRLQRDLYSAYLLQHVNVPPPQISNQKHRKTRNANVDGYTYDLDTLNRDYESFLLKHDQVIEILRNSKRTLASMGIVRRAS